ncbi:MAG: ATP-binding cassette domain-containing protein [Candidatus Thiodiazotropha sp. (ex Monitilora ramsayi)]|nr:ATP-binding cassette domain-containing protein [Candidatus Thiodiazotropha sp. (ex Monitilora ramsayi)]
MAGLRLKAFSTPLLDPFDLELEPGECITLSGPSGSGKSRLLRAIADLDPHGGEAWCDDTAQHNVSGPAWRRKVGLLPAESAWWSEQVSDHFTRLDKTALAHLNLPTKSTEWQVNRLSSGERQRLALLRLLSGQPQVLLLDEPTANLDKGNIDLAETLIEEWRKTHDTAVLWVTHDPDQQRRVGSHSLVIRNRGLVSAWN